MKSQAVMPILAALFTVLTCYATGSLLIAKLGASLRRMEKIALGFLLGAACFQFVLFAIFALKIAYKPVFMVAASAAIAGWLWQRTHSLTVAPQGDAAFKWSENLPAFGYVAIFLIYSSLYFVNAWAPETSPDGSGYHLGVITQHLQARGFLRIVTNMYSDFGEGAELLYGFALSFGRTSATALVHLSFAIALLLAMTAYGLRIGKWWVGAGAGLLMYLAPVAGRDASTAYVDMASAATAFAVFYWVELWEDSKNDRLLWAIGLTAGYAYAIKYTGAVMLLYALVVIVWRKRAIKPLLIVCAGAAVMILPWMIKDWIYVKDPIAPLGVAVFRNPYMHVMAIQEWEQYLRNYDIPNKWALPLEVTIRGYWTQGVLGPIFLLAPIGLLALRFRNGRRLLLAAAFALAAYPGNLGTRFLLPVAPFLAMAMTLVLANTPRTIAALVLIHAVLSWPSMIPTYARDGTWRLEKWPIDAALRRIPEDEYLMKNLDTYLESRMIEEHVPRGERILSGSAAAGAYTTHEVLSGFQAAFNQTLFDILYTGWNDGYRPRVALIFKFPQQTAQRVRILQTMKGRQHETWNVHEIRYLNGGTEISRAPEWKLTAWPNPWDVQLAFDNSPVTRWRSWEAPRPGMFIETDFGSPKKVDQITIETSTEGMWSVELQAEVMDAGGHWVKVAGEPEKRELPVPVWVRRAATYEIRAHGVRYVMARDDDFGAKDYLDDPDAWGFKVLARKRNVTLYEIVW